MVAYKTDTEEWHWENWTQLFDEDKCKYYINEEENIFIVVEPEESKIDWANYREINNLKSNGAKQPKCPLDKERAICEALKHFRIS